MIEFLALATITAYFHFKAEQMISFKIPANMNFVPAAEWHRIVNETFFLLARLAMYAIFPITVYLLYGDIFWGIVVALLQKIVFLPLFQIFAIFQGNKPLNSLRNEYYVLFIILAAIPIIIYSNYYH
ncbi:MAG: hypothetical protein JJU46_14660 [Balneolaceae bacterium]|nr:hypothetical protein [Balneolaceae bacterium]MCH8535961.1 hypothetical protein [Flavobacteriaceae bacterium]